MELALQKVNNAFEKPQRNLKWSFCCFVVVLCLFYVDSTIRKQRNWKTANERAPFPHVIKVSSSSILLFHWASTVLRTSERKIKFMIAGFEFPESLEVFLGEAKDVSNCWATRRKYSAVSKGFGWRQRCEAPANLVQSCRKWLNVSLGLVPISWRLEHRLISARVVDTGVKPYFLFQMLGNLRIILRWTTFRSVFHIGPVIDVTKLCSPE